MDESDVTEMPMDEAVETVEVGLEAVKEAEAEVEAAPEPSPIQEEAAQDAGEAAVPQEAAPPEEATIPEEPAVPEEPPAREDAAASFAKAGKGAAVAAAGAARHVAEGFAAIRDVRTAARQRSTAQTELKALKADLADRQGILQHRLQIDGDYERIVAESTSQLQAAQAELAEAQADAEALQAERSQLFDQLQATRARNEEELRPYKNSMDAARGRADDAAAALTEARRTVRSAETQLSDATRRRDQRLASANRTVENAQERLRRVQAEIDKLQGDPDAPTTALPKMRDELAAERAHLDAAREDVSRVTAECQQMVDTAQAQLAAHRQALATAERQAEDAKAEAASKRQEYERLHKQAKAQEDQISDAMDARDKSIAASQRNQADIASRISAAQDVIDEAVDIHSTPEVTAQLAEQVQAQQAEVEQREQEVHELAQSEKRLRKATRTRRIAFFAALIAIVLLVVALVWFFGFRR